MAPSPIPSPAGSAPPLSGTTLTARLVAALTLGSPASGIRVPIPDLPRGCAGVGGEAGAAAPPPPALDSALGNPEGKGRGGGAWLLEMPSPRGSPPAGLSFAPPSPLPTLRGSDGGGSCRADPGQGRESGGAGSSDPRGGKLGGGRRRVLGPGRAAGLRDARSPAGAPGGAPGWVAASRRGLCSARGSRHWAQAQRPRGRDPCIPRAPRPSRLRR